jgi:hypothetical protein
MKPKRLIHSRSNFSGSGVGICRGISLIFEWHSKVFESVIG